MRNWILSVSGASGGRHRSVTRRLADGRRQAIVRLRQGEHHQVG
jgi:hypothetical protein